MSGAINDSNTDAEGWLPVVARQYWKITSLGDISVTL